MRVVCDSRRLLVLSALACLLSTAPALADSNGTLRVAFTYQGIIPAVDISVILISPDRVREARTDKAGKIEFTGLPFQVYELEASSVSFDDVILHDIQVTSNIPMALDIPLQIWSPPQESESLCPPPLAIDDVSGLERQAMYIERSSKVNLTGIISSFLVRNRLLKDATITLVKFETPEIPVLQATSDINGKYEFADIEPGKYSLMVSYNGILERPYNFHFWVAKENLTRLGQIQYGLSQMNDNCGGTVMLTSPIIRPILILSPDLEIPFPLPFPPQPMYAYPRKKKKTGWRVFKNGKS
jgi:hypothetical protein